MFKRALHRIFLELGQTFLFLKMVFLTARRSKGYRSALMKQMVLVSYRSLGTVLFSGAFVGGILVLQFDLMLREYDALSLLGGLNTSAIVREVGPLIISFLLAGRIGAYTTAELATMRVTEQIDAIECLGTDPVEYLIVPRFFAIVISSVILLFMGLAISLLGAILIASTASGVNPLQYLSSIPRFAGGWTLMSGIFKSVVYAFIVASVCCFKGFTASGGARGVGRAVTQAAVLTNLYIVIANYLSSGFLDRAFEIWKSIHSELGGL